MPDTILIADDDPITRLMLSTLLKEWGYEVVEAEDGRQALEILEREGSPPLAILDWLMPGMDGVDVCRAVRESRETKPLYMVLLTVKTERADALEALGAGADDFLSKPFDYEELRVRLEVGKRVIGLQVSLRDRARELQEALDQVKTLSGLLPMCASCRKIRDDTGYWLQVEAYLSDRLDVRFSHGLCPDCSHELYPEYDLGKKDAPEA